MNVRVASLLLAAALLPGIGSAATLYVDLNSTNPVAPYASWGTASTNIQVALDAANAGDVVLVTNGVYSVGGHMPLQGIASRASVEKALTLASVNGPSTTFIVGAGRTSGFVRGVYLTNGAVLAGFTITNGTTSEQSKGTGMGGGVYCQSTNCQVTNCVISASSAGTGGGVYQGTLRGCTLFGNTATTLGGGAYQSVLESCALAGNTAAQGGGVANSLLGNCTLSGNSATTFGGGASQSTLNNCLVYYNTAPTDPNATGSALNYCCTTPLPGAGVGNLDAEPQLASLSHLAPTSPCRAAGSAAYALDRDIDGEAWASPPSIGCDEYSPSLLTGPISVSVVASYTNCAAGFSVGFTGWIWGKVTSSAWTFGDGSTDSYRPSTSHAWTNGGDFPVVLTAYNQDYPGGISATTLVHVVDQPIHYVSLASTNPVPPYTSWDTAATNIQAAVDAAAAPGESVVVSNGIYTVGATQVGGTTTTNRVAIQQKIRVRSLNGPLVTAIQGQRASAGGGLGVDAVRCVYLANGAVLDGFTLTNGSTKATDYGGGVYCQSVAATVTNCILSANYAYLGAGALSGNLINCTLQFNSAYASGGGCSSSTLTNCTLHDNGANNTGGGAVNATLYNCTLLNNRAENYGGGMAASTLNNCILHHNTAEYGGASGYGTLNNCIVTNNYGYTDGGGMYNGTANNCLFQGNGAGDGSETTTGGGAAYYGTLNACLILGNDGAWNGGGTYNSTANNCVLSGNTSLNGGGAYGGTLKNCTVVGNSGFLAGGGVYQATCYNCILYYNLQSNHTNNYAGANTFSFCCTSPDPGAGTGIITNEPALVDFAAGDWHLQPNSACINSGNNSFSPATTDLDDSPRIAGATVDLGAYEFPNPASLISYAWLQRYGLPADSSVDAADVDGDGLSNWQEWRAGTVPTDAASVLRLQAPATAPSGATLTWQSVSGIKYYLQRAAPALPLSFSSIQSNIVGAAGSTSFTDTNTVGLGQALYRVGVQ